MSTLQKSGTTPPHDIQAEAALLGAILLDNDAINRIISTCKADQFYKEAHRHLFLAMKILHERQDPIDTVTLSKQLKEMGTLKACGGGPYLVRLSNETPAAVNVEHYAQIVRDKATVRSIIEAARATMGEGLTDPGDVADFVERAQSRLFKVSSETLRTDVPDIREVIKETFQHIETLIERKEAVTGVPSGFLDLDKKLCGFQPSDLIIVAGRPSMGKTAFALNVIANAALKTSTPVVIFSLEMSNQQLATRLLCTHALVNSNRLRTGQVTDSDWSKLLKTVGTLSETKIFVDDTPALSSLELRARARRLKQEHGIGLIAIDYLQLMRGSELSAKRSREQEISDISRSLKALAKELEVPIIALSQLNRGVESRSDKRPLMSDLRESGAIEQDADVVMFLYRDEYYHPDTTDKAGLAEVIIGKQRNGPTGTVELKFRGEYTRFDNYSQAHEDSTSSPF